MAALIGRIYASDSRRRKLVHRLASQELVVEANTWITEARIELLRDGSGRFRVTRGNQTLNVVEWPPEPHLEKQNGLG
jgi:hypothetical protein